MKELIRWLDEEIEVCEREQDALASREDWGNWAMDVYADVQIKIETIQKVKRKIEELLVTNAYYQD